MKISIFAPIDLHSKLTQIISRENRLLELIDFLDTESKNGEHDSSHLFVEGNMLVMLPDWTDRVPPIVLPQTMPFTPEVFLGLVFFRLGNYEKTYAYLQGHPDLLRLVDLSVRLEQQVEINDVVPESLTETSESDTWAYKHNFAVARHYGILEDVPVLKTVYAAYESAFRDKAASLNQRAFTLKHFTNFLIDAGDLAEAENLLIEALAQEYPEEIAYGLKANLAQVWKNQLIVPYNQTLLRRLKQMLWETLAYYKRKGQRINEGLLLKDAAQIANISNSFAESLGYINTAINIFQEEEQTELLADAQFKKGILLFTWSQNGQTQFIKSAMDAFKAALKVFTRAATPEVFADIHHYLGIIYSEIPDEAKKKSVWAAVSVSSFGEALRYFTEEDHPYEYAMICHHFGNAYTKYPPAVRSDNFEKALEWYNKALVIRNAEDFPIERSHTLYNYLDACWKVGNPDEGFNAVRYEDMLGKANELERITDDPVLKAEAQEHILQLEQMKINYFEA